MNLRKRYLVTFLGLGWLILIGLAFRSGVGNGFHQVYGSVEASVARFGQSLSDREAKAWKKANRISRADEMAALRPHLTIDALRAPKTMLYGAYDGRLPLSFSGITELESELATRFPIISVYQAWGDKPDQAHFPLRMVETIDRLGSVPMISWEPWVVDFDEKLRSNLPPRKEREYASLAGIARGDYDFYVAAWAESAARYGKPLLLRFAHEMNDPYRYPWGPQNGNRPDDFIAAWQHVHRIFQKKSATNVLWLWSPHISMPWFEYYYPGDEWVDWIAIGVLNYGDVAPWSRWWSLHQILEKAYPSLESLGKPVMIAEFGTLTSGGDAAEWYRQAFHDIETKYGAIRSIVFFNQESDVTLSTAPLNWSVTQSPRVADRVRRELEPRVHPGVSH
jgi:hypothetical protein